MGLYDAILIKENHIAAEGSIAAALQKAERLHPNVEIEIEVEDLGELEEALAAGAKRILLDNFTLEALVQAVEISRGRARLEASGGVDLERVRAIAQTGVDDISIGAITKNLQSVDFSLRLEE
jgi:nicotinate-nucleotide pyrophosphorylase (carboxylating)